MPNFLKNKHFLPPDTHTCTYQGVRNVRFSENLVCFVFLEHLFWDLPFCLITDDLMNRSCGIVDLRKVFTPYIQPVPCQRFSPLQIFDTPRAGFKPRQDLSSDFVEWSYAVVISTTPRRSIWRNNCKVSLDGLQPFFSFLLMLIESRNYLGDFLQILLLMFIKFERIN